MFTYVHVRSAKALHIHIHVCTYVQMYIHTCTCICVHMAHRHVHVHTLCKCVSHTTLAYVPLYDSMSATVMDGHMSRIFGLAYHPHDPRLLVSAGWDDTVQVSMELVHRCIGVCIIETPHHIRIMNIYTCLQCENSSLFDLKIASLWMCMYMYVRTYMYACIMFQWSTLFQFWDTRQSHSIRSVIIFILWTVQSLLHIYIISCQSKLHISHLNYTYVLL